MPHFSKKLIALSVITLSGIVFIAYAFGMVGNTFSRVPIPRIETDGSSGHIFWINAEELYFRPEKGPAQILNIPMRNIRKAVGDFWSMGCRGGGPVYQANPFSTVENDIIFRTLQASSCAVAQYPPSNDQTTGWASFSLLADHGYVTLSSQHGDALLHKQDHSTITLNGLKAKELYGVINNVRFYPFKGAYLLHNTRPKEVTWLYPSGKLETISLNGVLDPRGNSWIYATKNGFLQSYYVWPYWRFVLLKGYSAIDIETRPVKHIAVSPDGCKVAYDYVENMKTQPTMLNLIDVCK